METDVVCPDCGKVIAPRGSMEDVLRCRCGEKGPRLKLDEVSTRPNISVPIPDIAPPADEPEPDESPTVTATREKRCYVCSKSLAGRTRLKDHLGRYWCKECSAADERRRKREDELRCADCSRVFPANKLQYFQTDRVCATCFKERERVLEKKIVKSNVNKIEKHHEWRTLKWMAIVAGGLILVATIFQIMR